MMRSHNSHNFFEARNPSCCVDFEDESRVISVQHEARPAIVFTVTEPIPIRLRIKKVAPSIQCRGQVLLPPGVIQLLRFTDMQHADANRSLGIKQAHPQETILPIINDREITRSAGAVLFANAVRKKPWMTGAQNRFRLL